ncbi:hypothetical protein [Klebsiella pneumoniae]|uniref:hypothetical protein n=1 Tax=Klebsiella pneumoniae TaxID=573 RepID=UPI0022B727A4|nr:hypothetical protein [Klebsiella pneumoniae]
MALYKTGNPVPSSAMPDVWDNNRVQDEILNSEELEVETRTGIMTPTWKGVLKKNEDEIEDTRQNLIPLSRQYMTLEAAQADIVNIPEGSTTYVRSADGSSLADEYVNNAGSLVATGRKMPSDKNLVKTTDEYSDALVFSWGKVMENGDVLPGTLQGMDGLPADENVAAYAAKGVAVYQLNPADIPAGHAIVKDGVVLLEADQSGRLNYLPPLNRRARQSVNQRPEMVLTPLPASVRAAVEPLALRACKYMLSTWYRRGFPWLAARDYRLAVPRWTA